MSYTQVYFTSLFSDLVSDTDVSPRLDQSPFSTLFTPTILLYPFIWTRRVRQRNLTLTVRLSVIQRNYLMSKYLIRGVLVHVKLFVFGLHFIISILKSVYASENLLWQSPNSQITLGGLICSSISRWTGHVDVECLSQTWSTLLSLCQVNKGYQVDDLKVGWHFR